MEKITSGQLACIHALIKKLNLKDKKSMMVAGFTGDRTESTGEMLKTEAQGLIAHLKSLDPDEVGAEKMRRYIISMAHESGYRIPGTTKVDMKRLDEWCVKYGYLHKKLNQYLYKELPRLVTQFEGVYKTVLKSL